MISSSIVHQGFSRGLFRLILIEESLEADFLAC